MHGYYILYDIILFEKSNDALNETLEDLKLILPPE